MVMLSREKIEEIHKVAETYAKRERERLRRVDKQVRRQRTIEDVIDKELLDQVKVQKGCSYFPSDDAGIGVATMNIVIPQLARRILAALEE